MSGVNHNSVARAALELKALFCALRSQDTEYPLDDQIGAWRHVIVSGFGTQDGAGTEDLITFAVPDNLSWAILHTAIHSQPEAKDPDLGDAPVNSGDFRSNASLNPYGTQTVTTTAQWLNSISGIYSPLTHSFAIQGQQHLIVVPGGNTAILRIDPKFGAGNGPVDFFAVAWGFLIPPQVGNVLSSIVTQWQPASSSGVLPV